MNLIERNETRKALIQHYLTLVASGANPARARYLTQLKGNVWGAPPIIVEVAINQATNDEEP